MNRGAARNARARARERERERCTTHPPIHRRMGACLDAARAERARYETMAPLPREAQAEFMRALGAMNRSSITARGISCTARKTLARVDVWILAELAGAVDVTTAPPRARRLLAFRRKLRDQIAACVAAFQQVHEMVRAARDVAWNRERIAAMRATTDVLRRMNVDIEAVEAAQEELAALAHAGNEVALALSTPLDGEEDGEDAAAELELLMNPVATESEAADEPAAGTGPPVTQEEVTATPCTDVEWPPAPRARGSGARGDRVALLAAARG